MNIARSRSSRKPQRRTRLCVECLEDRLVPSHVPTLTGLTDWKTVPLDSTIRIAHAGQRPGMGDPTLLRAVNEAEPPGTLGLNNTLSTAEYLPGFGTGPGDYSGADISGFTYSPPRTISVAEDDGSIPLA